MLGSRKAPGGLRTSLPQKRRSHHLPPSPHPGWGNPIGDPQFRGGERRTGSHLGTKGREPTRSLSPLLPALTIAALSSRPDSVGVCGWGGGVAFSLLKTALWCWGTLATTLPPTGNYHKTKSKEPENSNSQPAGNLWQTFGGGGPSDKLLASLR